MNVFVLSHDHNKRAEYHCDTHVNKMLLESAQLLNTALHKNGATEYTFYQPTHKNHPWTKWAADRYANWEWLLEHALALGHEFLFRSESDSHATMDAVEANWGCIFGHGELRPELEPFFDGSGERTRFPQAMPDEYYDADSAVNAYRDYYVNEKVPQDWCTWSNGVPEWVLERQ